MILQEILNQITLIKNKTKYSISHIEMSTNKYEQFEEETQYLSTTQRDNWDKELSTFLLSERVYDEYEAEKYNVVCGSLKEKQYIIINDDNIADLVVIVGKGDC